MDDDQTAAVVPPLTPARAGGRGAAAPLRLEERSNSDEVPLRPYTQRDGDERPALLTRARIRTYPDGDFEVTVTRRPSVTPKRKGSYQAATVPKCRERTAIQLVEDYVRSSTRARATVRRLIQAGLLDHMLTLTYRENRTDARECHADLTRFLRLLRCALPDDFQYVAVFERQKRGAGHWHLAVHGWQNVKLLRALWRKVVGDGNIDVRSWAGKGRAGECTAKLASYLSKYIGKEMDDRDDGGHRYRRSHNITIDERIVEYDDPDPERVAKAVSAEFPGREIRCIVRGEAAGECFLWACSWGGIPGHDGPIRSTSVPT